jgi:hypothetical protein
VTPVNIGDLMAKLSGNRWVATFLRVRSSKNWVPHQREDTWFHSSLRMEVEVY